MHVASCSIKRDMTVVEILSKPCSSLINSLINKKLIKIECCSSPAMSVLLSKKGALMVIGSSRLERKFLKHESEVNDLCTSGEITAIHGRSQGDKLC